MVIVPEYKPLEINEAPLRCRPEHLAPCIHLDSALVAAEGLVLNPPLADRNPKLLSVSQPLKQKYTKCFARG